MRISHQSSALARQFCAEIRPFIASQPQFARAYLRIGPAKHFKIEIRNDVLERHGRVRSEVLGAPATALFATEANEIDRSAWSWTSSECPCQLEDGDTA